MSRQPLKAFLLVVALCLGLLPSGPAVFGLTLGLGNAGFENDSMGPWEVVYAPNATDYVSLLSSDVVPDHGLQPTSTKTVAPHEGNQMLRLGRPISAISSSTDIQQAFAVEPGTVVAFAYNLCTYDNVIAGQHGDQFYYRLTTRSSAGAVTIERVYFPLPSDNQSGSLWCSGWQEVTVPLDDNAVTAELLLSLGNATADRATWVYLDAPAGAPEVRRIDATVDITPGALNPNGGGNGALTAYVELPVGDDVVDINPDSVTLAVNGLSLHPVALSATVGDYDGDGVADRAFSFSREAVLAALPVGAGEVTCTLSGNLGDTILFDGVDKIKVVGVKVQATAKGKK